MILDIDRTGTLDGFRAVTQRVANHPDVSTLIVLAADGNGHVPETTDPLLRELPLPVYGGVFPEIVFGREHLKQGTVVIGTRRPARATVVTGLGDPAVPLESQITHAIAPETASSLLFVFVDGLSSRIGALVRTLFEEFGVENNYIGGGAGSLSMQQRPCLFTNAGMLQNAALLLELDWPSGIGVAHGWEVISDAFVVTQAAHTTISALDHQPALDVYRRVVEPVAGCRVETERFFDVAKGFPFGIRKLDSEVIVRDPLFVTDTGGLVCVGEVPQGAFVHVLRGEPAQLIAAARSASQRATANFPAGREPVCRFLIDCISRSLFLGDDFRDELAALDDGLPMVGALTLGEIANSGREFLEFYNKTAVVGLIGTR